MKSLPLRLLLLASLLGASGAAAQGIPAAPIHGAELLWDEYGVPHIFATNRNALAYAFGWAQMRNHANLLLQLVAQARGRGAELFGPDFLEEDRWTWTLDLPHDAERALAAQPPDMRAHLEAFVAGINGFAATYPDVIPDSLRRILPVQAVDVIAHFDRVLYSRFVASAGQADAETRAWRARPAAGGGGPGDAERGSNAWAIAPKRTADGHTLLLQNPHLPWSDLFTWTEAQFVLGDMNLSGAALILSPVLQIAFNDSLGWTHTVNTQDGNDLYELTLSGNGYLMNGTVRAFDTTTHLIRVRQPTGIFTTDTLHVRRSLHGPVVAEKAGGAIAMSVVGLHGTHLDNAFTQWWNMSRARNVGEFVAAIRPNQISGQNITYADRAGNIVVFYGGNSPIRLVSDRAFWSGIVKGDTSLTVWSSLHTFDEMPRTVDPPSNWVQNANDPPWWATFPPVVKADNYPSYLASRYMGFRPQRSVRMLDSDSSITWDEFLADVNSTRLELADRLLDDLLPVASASQDQHARDAAAILQSWDHTADSASAGGPLFAQWWREYLQRLAGRSPFAVPWSESAPRTTPDGLADTALAVSALSAAADTVAARFGQANVTWGQAYRFRRDSVDYAASGASGELGAFRVVGYARDTDGKFVAYGGDSYMAAIEFTTPVHAVSLVTYGNASRDGSPHRTDQLPLFASKQFKPVWRSRDDVILHMELREAF